MHNVKRWRASNMKSRSIFQYVLGGLIIIGFFVLLVVLVYTQVPEPNKDLLNLVVGALIGSFATVVGYFYGSSAGSAAKTELMSKKDESDPAKV
jgi:drug/metabolite transporter (DMT)-like permease